MIKNIYKNNKSDYRFPELPSVAEMVVIEANQSWYRAKILTINGKQSANVLLIDQGQAKRNIPITNIYKMNTDLRNYPAQSFPGEFHLPIKCLPKYIKKVNGHRERLQKFWKYYFFAKITDVYGKNSYTIGF